MENLGAEIYYDQLAEKYETATRNVWSAPSQVAHVVNKIDTPIKSVFDIGIGTGQSVEQLYKRKQCDVIEGIDLSKNMLAICKEKYPKTTLHQGDFIKFQGFQHRYYDLLLCCGALEFFPDINLFFEKCRSICSKSSQFILTYEPRIAGHPVQNEYISAAKSERIPHNKDFLTYRHDTHNVNLIIKEHNFKVLNESLFVSYTKLEKEVVYSLLHLHS